MAISWKDPPIEDKNIHNPLNYKFYEKLNKIENIDIKATPAPIS